ncbi:MAG: hypothetical protein H8E73_10060 [Planctomycetes bacterium]|nr:hypothetical protein [Planctomycetota bacterium]
MNDTLQDRIKKDLCPDGIWELSRVMKSLLGHQIGRLPRKKVSENETRYPETPEGMRAFLEVFFARHFLQVQNSLVKYLVSEDGLNALKEGHLRILDIGSGPAVASLAITEIVACMAGHLVNSSVWRGNKKVQVTYVLNDTEGICLGTAQAMLDDYFKMSGEHRKSITCVRTLTSQRAFPDNVNQLRRIAGNIGGYDIAVFSYVLTPLKKDAGLSALAAGLSDVEGLCSSKGRDLILQDRFKAPLVRKVAGLIGRSSRKEELTQRTGHTRNENDTYTYSYYTCLYSPRRHEAVRKKSIA